MVRAETLRGRIECTRARLGGGHDRHPAARPAAQAPDREEDGADQRAARVAEQVRLGVPQALDEVAAEDAELVLDPLDVLVEAADGHPERERDDEDAADPRDLALVDRLSRVRDDPEPHEHDVQDRGIGNRRKAMEEAFALS